MTIDNKSIINQKFKGHQRSVTKCDSFKAKADPRQSQENSQKSYEAISISRSAREEAKNNNA